MKTKFICVFATLLIFSSAHAETLEQALNHTIATNPSIQEAVKARSASNAAVAVAESGFYPSIDLSAGFGRESSLNRSTVVDAEIEGFDSGFFELNRRELGASFSQMVFDGAFTHNDVERTKANMRSAAWQLVSVANDIGLLATESYLNVLREYDLVRVAKNNLVAHERTYKMIQSRADKGISRKADLVQARGRLSLARANLRTEEGNRVDSKIQYARVIGLEPRGLQKPVFPDKLLPKSLQEATEVGLENHPTIKFSNEDIEGAAAQHRAAFAPNYPRIDFFIDAHKDRNLDGVLSPNEGVAAVLRASWNIFNGGGDGARQRETAYLVQQATEIRNRAYRMGLQSVKLSWEALLTNRDLVVDFGKQVRDARSTVEAYRQQYKIGQRSLLDLLDAENEYFTARRSHINAQYDTLLAKYRILNSCGVLNQALNIPLPEQAYI